MSDPMPCCRAVADDAPASYWRNCDLLVSLDGLHVVDVALADARLTVTVASALGPMGCPSCGVVAVSHGRRVHTLVDAPAFGRPVRVRVRWRTRTWSCREQACRVGLSPSGPPTWPGRVPC